MEKVEETAEDRTLKDLASTTLPLIKKHLEVATDEVEAMS